VEQKMLKKSYKSCLSCSQKKCRCSGGSPCENCQKKGITCQYVQKIITTEVVLSKTQPVVSEPYMQFYIQKFLQKREKFKLMKGFQRKRTSEIEIVLNLQNQSGSKVPVQKLILMNMAVAIE
jgi:hypothetical protein